MGVLLSLHHLRFLSTKMLDKETLYIINKQTTIVEEFMPLLNDMI